MDILLVEDNPGDAVLIRAYLLDEAYTKRSSAAFVTVARTLAEARALLTERTFELALVDLGLPDSHGTDTVSSVVEASNGIPVIVLTGRDDYETSLAAMAAGADDYLAKDDLSPSLLARTVSYARQRYREQQTEKLLREAECQRTADLALLNHLNQTANQGATIDEILDLLVAELPQCIPSDLIAIYLVDEAARYQELRRLHTHDEVAQAIEALIGRPPVGLRLPLSDRDEEFTEALVTGEVFFSVAPEDTASRIVAVLEKAQVEDGTALNPGPAAREVPALLALKSLVNIPLLASKPLGSIVVGRRAPIAREERNRLSGVASQLSSILARKRLETQSERLLRQQTAANELALALGSSRDLHEIYRNVHSHVNALMDADAFIVSQFEPRTQMILTSYAVQAGEVIDVGGLPPLPLAPEGQGSQSTAIRTGEVLYVADQVAASRTSNSVYHGGPDGALVEGTPPENADYSITRSAIYAPMKDKGEVIGVMQVQSFRLDAYSADDVGLMEALANMAAMAIQNARLFQAEQERRRVSESLVETSAILASTLSVAELLQLIISKLHGVVAHDTCSVQSLDGDTLEIVACNGFPHPERVVGISFPLDDKFPNYYVIKTEAPLPVDDVLETFPHFQDEADAFESARIRSWLGLPLIARNRILGMITVDRSQMDPFSQDEIQLAMAFANEAAVAIENARLFSDLERSNEALTLAYDKTIEGWASALEIRDAETVGHSRRVTSLSVALGKVMGLTEPELVNLRRGALLHDIGKMGVPDEILRKPGKLTDEEWVVMKMHPVWAYQWLSPIEFLQDAVDVPWCHHERWDGTGYPRGLSGEEIPLGARIFAIIDVWDALLSDRPYRAAWTRERALAHIREQSGKHFDPDVVDAFMWMMEEAPATTPNHRLTPGAERLAEHGTDTVSISDS